MSDLNLVLLTDAERDALAKLADAWNLFLKLPIEHSMHQQEFAFYIHGAQRIIWARAINRRVDKLSGASSAPRSEA